MHLLTLCIYNEFARGTKRRRLHSKSPYQDERKDTGDKKDDERTKDDEKYKGSDGKHYLLMYYKNHTSWAIRRSGAQALPIARKGSDPRDLEVLAKKALNSLNQDMDIEEAKLLVKFKLQTISNQD